MDSAGVNPAGKVTSIIGGRDAPRRGVTWTEGEALQDQQRPSKLLLKKASRVSLYVWVRCVVVRSD